MEKAANYFYGLLFILVMLTLLGLYIYKKYFSQKYTRERFAFFSISAFTVFLLGITGMLLAKNQLLDFIAAFLKSFGYDIQNYGQLDPLSTSLFILASAGMLYFLILSLFKNWDKPNAQSTRQIELQETKRTASLLDDAIYYWKYRDKIEIYTPKEKSKRDVFSPYQPDTRPWHVKAANLFSLLDQQYHIRSDDWYGEYQCYLSSYGKDHEKLAILCCTEEPDLEHIIHFIKFVNSQNGDFKRLIVAIAGKGTRHPETHEGREIQFRYEAELLDNLAPLTRYRDFINEYFDRNKLENSDLKMSDMYVPLGGHTVAIEKEKLNKDQPLSSAEEYILDWASGKRLHQTEHLAILGEYGQGKTVLLHKVVKEMLANPERYERIPILIELRGLSPRNDNEFSIFGHWANRYQAKAEALWELHRAGKLLVILDGFDEMDLVGDTELLFNHFAQLWTLAKVPNSQILIAGRPNLFADDLERRMALGIQSPRIDLPYAQAVYLDKLTPEQIEQVLRRTQPDTKNGILHALETSPAGGSFAELVNRPSTLYQLSTVWDSELAKHKDRLNSAVVIGSFLNKTYERQERKNVTVLTSFERNYFMMGIGVGMMLGNAYTNQVKHKDLRRLVEKLWLNYPEKLPPYQDAMQGNRATDFLPERLKKNPDALETILKDVQVGGVLVQDLSGRDVFKFAHKSYLEYLVSAFFSGFVLQNEHNRALLMMVNAIGKAMNFNQSKLVASPDVDAFTAEMIANQIEINDAQGNPFPIKGNEAVYSNAVFEILVAKSYPVARLFPKLAGWIYLHPDQRYFLGIGLGSILATIGYLGVTNENAKLAFISFNSLLCWCWAGLLIKYRRKKETLFIPKPADFSGKTKLYLATCRSMECPADKVTGILAEVVQRSDRREAYNHFVVGVLAFFIAFAGAFAFAFALKFAGSGEVPVKIIVTVAMVGVFVGAFVGVGAFVRAGVIAVTVARLVGGKVAVAIVDVGAVSEVFAPPVTVAVVVAVAVAVAGAGAEAGAVAGASVAGIYCVYLLKKKYQTSLKALLDDAVE